jgi:hypothetical protein
MNRVARLSQVDRADAELSIVAQCRLLKVARSSRSCMDRPLGSVACWDRRTAPC